jgi:hypothetical protein
MTCKISRSVFAFALALGMLAALSNPSRAALSTADRTNAVAAVVPAPEQTTVAAVSPQQPVTPAATPAPAPAPATVAAAAPVAQPRKIVAPKATPRRIASFAARGGYPCH